MKNSVKTAAGVGPEAITAPAGCCPLQVWLWPAEEACGEGPQTALRCLLGDSLLFYRDWVPVLCV